MLRTSVAAAITDSTLSVFLEPIALYHGEISTILTIRRG